MKLFTFALALATLVRGLHVQHSLRGGTLATESDTSAKKEKRNEKNAYLAKRVRIPSKYESARCLDDSPAAFYFRPAPTEDNNPHVDDWLIILEGGHGFCDSEALCKLHSQTYFGTSRNLPPQRKLDRFQLSDEELNPLRNYNMVYLHYCSSDLWLGNQEEINATVPGVRFSGQNIIRATLKLLRKGGKRTGGKSIKRARTIILGAEGAATVGGLAILDEFSAKFPHAKVVGTTMGGMMTATDLKFEGANKLDILPYDPASAARYHKIWDANWPDACHTRVVEAGESPSKCLYPWEMYKTLETPVFLVQSQVDFPLMRHLDGLPTPHLNPETPGACVSSNVTCPQHTKYFLSAWRELWMAKISTLRPRDGLFAPQCVDHSDFGASHPRISGLGWLQAFDLWLNGLETGHAAPSRFIDHLCTSEDNFNCNPTCPPVEDWCSYKTDSQDSY